MPSIDDIKTGLVEALITNIAIFVFYASPLSYPFHYVQYHMISSEIEQRAKRQGRDSARELALTLRESTDGFYKSRMFRGTRSAISDYLEIDDF